jgi:3-isopropylmalate dehydrogenase
MIKKSPTIVLLGGEGIGPEVVEATARVIGHLIPSVTFERPLHGEEVLTKFGSAIPPITQQTIRKADAILFGSTWKFCGDVLRFLRWGLDTFANLRPAKTRPGLYSPLKKNLPLDILIVRENVEGEYPSREGNLRDFDARWPDFKDIMGRHLPPEGLFSLRVTTEKGSHRISEIACKEALRRRKQGRPGKVTIVTKDNVLKKSDGMFRKIAQEVLQSGGVPYEHYYVDDACRRLISQPESFDVILTPNLFGDIMSDIALEIVGGLGVGPSACIGEHYAYFESVHGSAPDIAGKGIANPLATILSGVMMLEHLGFVEEAQKLDDSVNRLLQEQRVLTPDLGGHSTTTEVIEALIKLMRVP